MSKSKIDKMGEILLKRPHQQSPNSIFGGFREQLPIPNYEKMDKGTPFMEAMSIVSYAERSKKCIPTAYFDVNSPWVVKDEQKENS